MTENNLLFVLSPVSYVFRRMETESGLISDIQKDMMGRIARETATILNRDYINRETNPKFEKAFGDLICLN